MRRRPRGHPGLRHVGGDEEAGALVVGIFYAAVEIGGLDGTVRRIEHSGKLFDGARRSKYNEAVAFLLGGGEAACLRNSAKPGRFISERKTGPSLLGNGRDGDFVAQVFAGGAQLFDDGGSAPAMRLPSRFQIGALRHLLAEDVLGFAEILREIGDAGEEDGVRGQAAEQMAL